MEEEENSVFVSFNTRLKEYDINVSDSIAIPMRLKRLGLSKVINHLLGREGEYFIITTCFEFFFG